MSDWWPLAVRDNVALSSDPRRRANVRRGPKSRAYTGGT